MQHDTSAVHVVKGVLPCRVHHALHALLIERQHTWQDWIMDKAHQELTAAKAGILWPVPPPSEGEVHAT